MAEPAVLEIHEAWTAPPVGAVATATHVSAEAFGVWLAPIELPGLLRLRHISGHLGNGGTVALALYRMEQPRALVSRDSLIESVKAYPWRKVTALTGASTGLVFDPDAEGKVKIELEREVVLDPRRHIYAVGYQNSAASVEWLCPSTLSVSATTTTESDIEFYASNDPIPGTTPHRRAYFYVPSNRTVTVLAQLGSRNPAHTATLLLRDSLFVTKATLTRTGTPTPVSASATLTTGYHDIVTYSSAADGYVVFHGGVLQGAGGGVVVDDSRAELLRCGYKTRPLGTAMGDFPDLLHVVGMAHSPVFALRSATGVRRGGHLDYD
ncbi:MAG TPA: hypothetical protein VD948_02805 [Rhodothermales bacterium]|nr:hypothetical protein [Rhodothermales bacterium]